VERRRGRVILRRIREGLKAGYEGTSPTVKRAFLLVFLVLIGGLAFGSYRLYEYTENNPNFCRSCHLMEKAWDLWNTSEHTQVTCHGCHSQSITENARLFVKFVTQRPQEVETHAVVPSEVCERCHVSFEDRWIQIGTTKGHWIHHEEQGIACVECHSISIHRFTPPAEICRKCHPNQTIRIAEMGRFHCTTCHHYLGEGGELRPERKDCLSCHERMGKAVGSFPSGLAPMKFECRNCHKPHESPRPISCNRCHDVSESGYHRLLAHSVCTTCHTRHTWILMERAVCEKCHIDRKEHRPGRFCGECHAFETPQKGLRT
jgi:nitrate/TMAO reductase-like tetraheme cytochrome c subunit